MGIAHLGKLLYEQGGNWPIVSICHHYFIKHGAHEGRSHAPFCLFGRNSIDLTLPNVASHQDRRIPKKCYIFTNYDSGCCYNSRDRSKLLLLLLLVLLVVLLALLLILFLGLRKYFGCDTLVDTMMQLVVPNFTGRPRLVFNAILTGLVIGQWFGTGRNARFANVLHLVHRVVVFVGLSL